MAQFQPCKLSWLRFSVALPLGINEDACPRWTMGWNDPNWLDFSDRSQRGRNEHREIAALRRGWLRPGRFFEPQNSAHSSLLSCRRQRGVQRAPSSCSPPHGWRRTARPKEPQKLGPFVFDRSRRRTNIKAEAASKRRCASPPHPGAAGRPLTREPSYSLSPQIPARAQPKACPSSPPRVRLTAAPLSLRRCRRPLGFHLDFAHRKTSEIPL